MGHSFQCPVVAKLLFCRVGCSFLFSSTYPVASVFIGAGCWACIDRETKLEDRTGSNGFKTFGGYKDDNLNGANYNYHSCVKKYYYV